MPVELDVAARFTVPANPFCAVAVMPAVASCPTIAVTEGTLAATVKSCTTKVTVVVCVVVALTP
jgi:hypothetical protein